MNHITSGIGDKVIQTRQYCTSHLKIFIDVHGVRSRHTLEANSGLLDAIETAVKRALADVNAAVRDSGRAAFWSFLVVWPQRAAAIMNDMDGLARKQLEKAKPGQSSSAAALPPPPTAVPRKASSAMSQLLAEKRKAKAAELAVGSSASESARVVSSPTPTFPSVQQELARTTSSTLASTSHRDTPLNRSATSQLATSREGTPRLTSKPTLSSSQELQRSRSSSLDCSLPTSPPSSHGSPTSLSSPLRQINTVSSGLQSPASKVSPAGIRVLRSPTSLRKPIPSFSSEQRGTNGRHQSPESRASERSQTSVRAANSTALTPARRVVAGDLRAQAGEAISSSQSLLDFTDDESIPSVILTPKRSTKFHHPQTPANHKGTNMAWEDSPRREAMTPVLLDKLRERKHERSWWLKRQHRASAVDRPFVASAYHHLSYRQSVTAQIVPGGYCSLDRLGR